ncbi:hypothetical protein MMC30_003615 [Trapelia coarctata]|nr:hypothetical protein [Trapelia coarctata]
MGLPRGRPPKISNVSRGGLYTWVRTIDGPDSNNQVGGLNLGVYLVKRRVDNKLCVQKKIDGTNKVLRREVHLLHHLKHPNIVEFVDAFITPKPREVSLYMEYCDLGSLGGLINRYNEKRLLSGPSKLPEAFIWHVFQSIAKALQYIHHGLSLSDPSPIQPDAGTDEDVVKRLKKKWPTTIHRDIKLHNILITQSQPLQIPVEKPMAFPFCFLRTKTLEPRPTYPRIVLADFGTACQEDDEDWLEKDTRHAGTYSWMPPELPKWTERGDIWALGAVILSLCKILPKGPVAYPPAGSRWERDFEGWFQSKRARVGVPEHRLGEEYSEDLDDLIFNCVKEEMEERPFAFRLVEFIREGKERAKLRGRVRFEALPGWAFEQK